MRVFIGAVTLILVGASLVHAQQRDTTGLPDSVDFRIPAIEVIGSIAMTAAGPSIRSGLAGRSVSITGRELRAWRPSTVADAVVPVSASAYDDLGSTLKQSVIMRGFSVGPVVGMPQGVSVFIDGVPMNEPGSGEVSFDLLPLEHVERIDVLTGTGALLGPNSLGGALNLVTRRGGDARSRFELEAGSHELFGGTASTAGAIRAWDYYAGGGHEREKGWRRRMSGKRSHLFATVGTYGARSGVRVQILAAQSDAETAGSLPLSVYAVRPDSNLTAGDFEALWQTQLAASGYTALFGGLASARVFVRGNGAERFNANHRWVSRVVSADVAIYRSNVRDDIFLFPYEDADEPAGSTIDGYFGNVARTRREGLEAGARASISRHLSAWGSYALSRATFESADVEIFSVREAAGAENEIEIGDRFPLVPAATLSAGVDGVIDRFEAGVAVAHVGRRYLRGDESNDEAPLESYTIADVRAGFDVAGWQLNVLLRNATNSRYINFGTFNINQGAGGQLERFVTPGAPRRLEISIGRTFHD
jgi:hypothetical protein